MSTVRTGIATALETITGLRCHAVWPDTVNCPAALVRPVRYESHTTFASRATLWVEVVLVAAAVQNDLSRAQEKLDAYLNSSGTSSIIAALEAAPTFPVSGTGTCENSQVSGWEDYGSVEIGGIEYLSVRFQIEAWVTF